MIVDVPFENGNFSKGIGSMINISQNTMRCDEGAIHITVINQ